MHQASKTKSSPPRSGSWKYPTNIYIYNPQTHPKAYLRRKGSGAGRNFARKFSNRNTLPIQIYLTLVETSGGTTSVGLWFQSISKDPVKVEFVKVQKNTQRIISYCSSTVNIATVIYQNYFHFCLHSIGIELKRYIMVYFPLT